MKKTFLSIFIVLSLFLFITGCKKEEKEYLKLINYTELKEKIDKKESFILIVTRTDCSHCAQYIPILKTVLDEYKVTAYQVEVDTFSDEEKSALKNICNVSGTPTTLFITEGEEKTTSSRLVGDRSRSQIISRFKAMGYIDNDVKEE